MSNRMDTVVAKSKGLIKGLKARRDGLTGVFRTLAEEHTEVAYLDRAPGGGFEQASFLVMAHDPDPALVARRRGEAPVRSTPQAAARAHRDHTARRSPRGRSDGARRSDRRASTPRIVESDDWGALFDQLLLPARCSTTPTKRRRLIFPVAQRGDRRRFRAEGDRREVPRDGREADRRRGCEDAMAAKKPTKWSHDVTEHSNALDRSRPASSKRAAREKSRHRSSDRPERSTSAQGVAVSIRALHVDVLYQPRGQQLVGAAPANAPAREGRAQEAVRSVTECVRARL